MASYGYTFQSGDGVTPTRLNDARTVSDIVNADIKSDAAIAGTKIVPAFGAQDITVSTANRSITNTGNFALSFGTNNTERVRISNDGKVGIGTSSPAAPLHVARSSSGALRISGGSGDYTAAQIINTSGVEVQIYANGNSAAGLLAVTNHPLLLHTNNTERMRIDASGNVGIGTNSPTRRLTVVGPAANGAGNEALWVDANGVQFAVRKESSGAGVTEIGTPNNHNLALFANGTVKVFIEPGGSTAMRVKGTGQVRFLPLSSDPAGGEAGDVYYNSATNKLKVYNGSSWVDLH